MILRLGGSTFLLHPHQLYDAHTFNWPKIGLLDYGLSIPGNDPNWHFKFNCHGDVLARMLSKDLEKEKTKVAHEGVTFFATHLHTHSNGRKLWVDHEREGKVIGKRIEQRR